MAELTDKLITFAYLKSEVDVPQNINSEEFDHKIYKAQERLRMLMGDEFYRDFLAKYKANQFSAAYTAAYNPYIKQFVAWQAFVFWTIEANYKPTRAGYRIHSEENSVAVPADEMEIIIKDRKQSAEYYSKLLIGFLDNHSADYELYKKNCRPSTANTFHLSAVKNKHDENCNCRRCRC
ncbi:MAG: hypothetical protein QOA70_08160 [Nitrososphaeraceae archaeon]|nr:hypothetical protein [Nitrososphaeraceae archaeon]